MNTWNILRALAATPDFSMGHWILNTAMQPNDADAATIREYLVALAGIFWEHGEGAPTKRPFGNSGWQDEIYIALARAGHIDAEFAERYGAHPGGHGELLDADYKKGNELIKQALAALAQPAG